MSTSLDADVVIVGYGPVGQTLAPLLAVRVIAWPCTSVEERGIDFVGVRPADVVRAVGDLDR